MIVVQWIIINLLAQHTGLLVNAFSCLTWKYHQNELYMIYKTKNFSSPLYFYDNDGVEKGFCDFDNVCDNQSIFIDVPTGSAVLRLKVVERSKISGNWSCRQGSHFHSTYVTESGDFDSSMQLLMKGKIFRQQNKSFVNVECSSCREPYRNKVYYVLNNIYGDVIYKTNSNSCSSNNGICDGFLCSCSTWPIFRKTYPKDNDNEMIFTCSMRFHQGSKYIDRTSRLSFDGNNSFTFLELIHQKGSSTKYTTTVNTPETQGENLSLRIAVPVGIFAIIFVVIIINYLMCRMCKRKKLNTYNDVEIPLMQNRNSDRCSVIKHCLDKLVSPPLRLYIECCLDKLYEDYKDNNKCCCVHSNEDEEKQQFSKKFFQSKALSYNQLDECSIESLLEVVCKIKEFPEDLMGHALKLKLFVLKPCKSTEMGEEEFKMAMETMKQFLLYLKPNNKNLKFAFLLIDKYGSKAIDEMRTDSAECASDTEQAVNTEELRNAVSKYAVNELKVWVDEWNTQINKQYGIDEIEKQIQEIHKIVDDIKEKEAMFDCTEKGIFYLIKKSSDKEGLKENYLKDCSSLRQKKTDLLNRLVGQCVPDLQKRSMFVTTLKSKMRKLEQRCTDMDMLCSAHCENTAESLEIKLKNVASEFSEIEELVSGIERDIQTICKSWEVASREKKSLNKSFQHQMQEYNRVRSKVNNTTEITKKCIENHDKFIKVVTTARNMMKDQEEITEEYKSATYQDRAKELTNCKKSMAFLKRAMMNCSPPWPATLILELIQQYEQTLEDFEAKHAELNIEYQETETVSKSEMEKIKETSGTRFELNHNKKRWLLVGIGLHTILSPSLRKYVEPRLCQLWQTLQASHNIDTQLFPNHLKVYNSRDLNYETINNNKALWGRQRGKYNYCVRDGVDLFKLFLDTNMAKYSALNDSCDSSALLGIIINTGICSQNGKACAEKVRSDIRNCWSNCDITEWTDIKYTECCDLLKRLVQCIGFSAEEEKEVIEQLDKWNKDGEEFIDGTTLEYARLSEIKNHIQDLARCVKTMADGRKQISKIQKELSTIGQTLAIHAQSLKEHSKPLNIHTEILLDQTESIKERSESLKDHTDVLEEHKESRKDHTDSLKVHANALNDHTEKIKQLRKDTESKKDYVNELCNNRAEQKKNKQDKRKVHIDAWKEDDKNFTVTRATSYVTQLIDKNNVVVVTGSSGSGKSSIIHHVALELATKKGYEIIPSILSPADIIQNRNMGKDQVFVLDDFCGKSFINEQKLQTWKKREDEIKKYFSYDKTDIQDIKDDNKNKMFGNRKFLVSCQLQIYKDSKFKTLKMFTEDSCNLESKEHCLLLTERKTMIKKYAKLSVSDMRKLDKMLDKYPHFPLICKMSKNKGVQEVINLLSSPFEAIREDIQIMIESKPFEFCALVLCVLFDNRFNEDYFYPGETSDAIQSKLEEIFNEFDIDLRREFHRNHMMDSFRKLEGTYIKKSESYYTIVHDKLFDLIAFSCGRKLIRLFIKYSPTTLIAEVFRFSSVFPEKSSDKGPDQGLFLYIPGEDDSSDDHDRKIREAEKVEKLYFDRLFQDLKNKDGKSFFQNQQLSVKAYRNKVMNYINTNTKKCRELFTILEGNSLRFDGELYFSTPLIEASKIGFVELVEFLLSLNCNINQEDSVGYTPLYYSCINGHLNVLYLLKGKGANIQDLLNKHNLLVYFVCERGYTDILRELLIYDAKLSQCEGEWGETPLYAACRVGHINIVRLLLDKNFDPLVGTRDGRTPMYAACEGGHIDIVRLLLDKNVDSSTCDRFGRTPLRAACNCGHIDIVKILLDRNVDPSTCDNNGQTPLYAACEGGHIDIVRLLLDTHVDPLKCNDDGQSPLYSACEGGHIDIVRLLLNKNVDSSTCDRFGRTPLHAACNCGHIDIVRLLLDKNVDSSTCDRFGRTPLHAACNCGHIDTVRLLLDKKVDPSKYDNNGQTPLYTACKDGQIDIVRLLLDKNVNTSLSDVQGYTPLHVACLWGHTTIVKLLLNKNVDRSTKTKEGKTPLDLARKKAIKDVLINKKP